MDPNVGIAKFNALNFEMCFETRIDNFVWYFGIKFTPRILTLLTTSNLCKMKVL
jgi:hypothetical protein